MTLLIQLKSKPMFRTEKTRQAETLYYIKQGYKMMCKEIGKPCKDKNFVIGCVSCQTGRILKDYGSLIENLKWVYDTTSNNS
jgi:hypothetical protein